MGIFRCSRHLTGPERIEVDRCGEARLRRWLTSANAIRRQKGEAGLAAASRRRLLEGWRTNPELPGRTLALTKVDELRVRNWLAAQGIALDDPLPQTGHPPTPRTQDRLRWIAARHLSGRADDRTARWELVKAVRDDARWQKRKAALIAAGQPLPLPHWPTFGAVPKAIIIQPPAPPSKAKKDASVAQLRHSRAHRRIAAKTTGARGVEHDAEHDAPVEKELKTPRPRRAVRSAVATSGTAAGGQRAFPVIEAPTPAQPPPPYLSIYSPAFAEVMGTLRAGLDLDRQTDRVQDRIGRAAWSYAHNGMSAGDWAKLSREFRVLCGLHGPAPPAPAGTGAAATAAAMADDDRGW